MDKQEPKKLELKKITLQLEVLESQVAPKSKVCGGVIAAVADI